MQDRIADGSVLVMGKHRVPKEDQTTNPRNDSKYVPKHGAAGSDLPPRGEGLKSTIIRKVTGK